MKRPNSRTKVNRLTNEELVCLAADGDRQAEEFLIYRFHQFVYERARSYFLPGADCEDLVQEGMIGLCEAIRAFDAEKCPSFSAFASVCVTRQILSAVKHYNRQKHMPLNFYHSLYAPMGEDGDGTLLTVLADETAPDLEADFIGREEMAQLQQTIKAVLTPLEQAVLSHYIDGESQWSIARRLDKSVKAVDSTLQRIRRKLRQTLLDEN